jgi:hypothetical protein
VTIDPDVAAAAKHWAGDSQAFARLIQAVVIAEGNIVRAVQISIPSITNRADALDVVCRSAVHAMADFLMYQAATASPSARAFVTFWAARWAPQGVANDPTNLNANWPGNVYKNWVGA